MEKFFTNLYNEIITMTKDIVVKRNDLAQFYETADTVRDFERYYAAVRGDDFFYNNIDFEDSILLKYLDTATYLAAKKNVNAIPVKDRIGIVKDQMQYTIDHYEEKNNYYRMLIGLPDNEDKDYIYLTDLIGYESTPIHLLPNSIIQILYQTGRIDSLLLEYPDKKYLKFIGSNKLNLITIRLARPFEVLKLGQIDNLIVREHFMKEYNIARHFIMYTVYNRNMFTSLELYDGMIGMIILTHAIRNTLSLNNYMYWNTEEILDMMLESYGMLEYFKYLPMLYKKRLLLSIDYLLANKGTDLIFIDICKIFSYDSITIKRYYLLKKHTRDNNGDVLFPKLPNGDIDYDKLYNLEFLKVPVDSDYLDYTDDIEPYDSVTLADPLWIMTDDEVSELKREEFNILMSKYISIDSIYNLNEVLFEMSYFINLLLDLRIETTSITSSNMYSDEGVSDAFTLLIMFLAAICKKLLYDGNIVYEPAHIAQVYKFDLNVTTSTIQTIIDKYGLNLEPSAVLIPLDKSTMTSAEVIEYYNSMKEIYKYLLREMDSTTIYKEYVGLRQVFEILTVSTLQKKIFVKSDNTPAVTYLDMLYDLDSSIGKRIDEAANDILDDIILYSSEKLELLFSDESLKYLFGNIPNLAGNIIGQYLGVAINIFKANIVEISSFNTIFNFDKSDTRIDKIIRAFDEIYKEERIETIYDYNYLKDKTIDEYNIILNDYVYSTSKVKMEVK